MNASDFNRIPQVPDNRLPFLGWIYFANDGLGHNYGGEEDDLRTYGFTSGFAFLDSFLITADWQSFNDRNKDAANSLRIDEVKSLAGARIIPLNHRDLYLSLMGGLGGMFYGNFGTLGYQTNAHQMGGVKVRDIPHNYDFGSQSYLGFLYSELYFPHEFLNFTLYSHLTHKLDYSIDVSASYWMVKELTQIKFTIAYQYNRAENSGSVVRNVLNAENGFWFSSRVLLGPLVFERAVNFNTMNQSGNAGFKIDLFNLLQTNCNSAYRYTYSFGWPIGHNSNIE